MHFRHRCAAWCSAAYWKSYERPTLAKEALLTLEGQIDEILPDGRFGVMLDNEHRIVAYTAGKMRKFRIRSVVGDRVHVEMTPYDLTKGRIVFRERTPGAGPGGGIRRRGGFKR
jgi:translation initiation factor IF-1